MWLRRRGGARRFFILIAKVNLPGIARHEATLETVESFGVGYGQGANTGDWMKPPGDLFLYCDMKDLGADMVFYIFIMFIITTLNNRWNILLSFHVGCRCRIDRCSSVIRVGRLLQCQSYSKR